jgi:hypothetical protein
MNRKSWDEYFMDIAKAVATRATCDRKFVGAVVVRDKRSWPRATTAAFAASRIAARLGT